MMVFRRHNSVGREAFTLIEMTLVLLILGILAHLAVREMGKVHRKQVHRQAEEQLSQLQRAVYDHDHNGEAHGFLVDMGRLPRAMVATNENGRVVLTLGELWRKPADVAKFALRPAVASNLVEGVASELVDADLRIPCGWGGPYISGCGSDRICDPWGNPLETPDDAGFSRLLGTNSTELVEGAMVCSVRHFGADARPDGELTPADAADRDGRIDFADTAALANPLVVNVSFVNAQGPAAVTGARCRWYMPSGAKIAGGIVASTASASAIAAFNFEGLPIGVCTLVVDLGSAESKVAVERVEIPVGGKIVNLKAFVAN